ncbi:MAG: hypothetical protein K6U79_07220 [Firmicutes bacterium]|nr:hypothetical protein [Bacillota bacterium]
MSRYGRDPSAWATATALALAVLLSGCSPAQTRLPAQMRPPAQAPATPGRGAPASEPPGPPLENAGGARLADLGAIERVRFLDRRNGWATGRNGILRTEDGGASWTDVTPKVGGAATEASWNGYFLDLHTAWALRTPADPAAPAVLYRTVDGGRSWAATLLRLGGVADVRFAGRLTGWILVHRNGAAGSELVSILQSGDGGTSWTEIARTEPASRANPGSALLEGTKTGIASADPDHIRVTGSWAGPGVLLYRSADGGRTWSRQTIPVPAGFHADGGAGVSYPPVFSTAGEGVLPVVYTGQGFVLYRTRNGGRTWTPSTPVRFRAEGPSPAYSIIDGEHVVVTDGVDLYRTDDGGESWTTVHPEQSLAGVTELGFVDPSWGWAVVRGAQGTGGGAILWITLDGGRTWTGPGPGAGAPHSPPAICGN